MNIVRSIVFLLILALTWSALAAPRAFAGGSPETTLVVVNADSPLSLRLANEYMALRNIPRGHLLRLSNMPNTRVIPVEMFRKRIGTPLREFLVSNDLEASIDTITYSFGFPYGIDFNKDCAKPNTDKRVPRIASLNSMTYLLRRVLAADESYAELPVNRYFRGNPGNPTGEKAHGFRSTTLWDRRGLATQREFDDEVDSYYLSTLLGFCGTQGTTYGETMNYLRRAMECDGTHPKGTVYYMENSNVRSKARFTMFRGAISHLEKSNRKGEILKKGESGQDGISPLKRRDVFGLVAGTAKFKWPSSSTLLPGSIAEHLTSFGGRLDGSGQTKLTEYLRAGAAGSSGTVAEPLALWQKFPTPYIHGYYAQGCSLAESFYQSVLGPYQLLIVGEPLARPFAYFKALTVECFADDAPLKDAAPWAGMVTLRVKAEDAKKTPEPNQGVGSWELWIDGKLVRTVAHEGDDSAANLKLDTAALPDGAHELRIVAVEQSDVATRTTTSLQITTENGASNVTCKANADTVRYDKQITISGTAGGVDAVEVRDGLRLLKRINKKGGGWRVKFDAADVGLGKVAFHAVGLQGDKVVARSQLVLMTVEPSPMLKPKKVKARKKKKKSKRSKKSAAKKSPPKKKGKKGEGLIAVIETMSGETIEVVIDRLGTRKNQTFAKALKAQCNEPVKRISLYGSIEFKDEGFYEWAIHCDGTLRIDLDGKTQLVERACTKDALVFALSHLKAGWHGIEIEYTPTGAPHLDMRLGGDMLATPVAGAMLRTK